MTFVEIVKNTPMVSTLIIAEGMDVGHKATMQLITKYKSDFEDLGLLTFEMSKRKIGRPTKFTWLNEEQAIFVCTLMKNSQKVVSFKKRLSVDFIKMRNALNEIKARQRNASWVEKRNSGKISRRAETDIIKEFIEYAINHGSKNAKRYYTNITKMENKALFIITQKFSNLRDVLDGQQIATLCTCDQIVAKSLRDGMKDGMYYKSIYKKAKADVESFIDLVGTSYVPSGKKLLG